MDEPSVAIITGASSGIGRQTAMLLAERGTRVVLVGRRRDELDKTAGMLAGQGHRVYPADLSEHTTGEHTTAGALIKTVREEFGRLDVLVNNAGLARLGPLSEGVSAQDIHEHVMINTIAPALLVAAAWPLMLEGQGACLVNVSSMSTIDPFPGLFAYALSKAGLNVMLKSCINEGESRVRAFGIAPGCVETPMLRGLFDQRQVPPEIAITPRDAAMLVVECIDGQWDEANGGVISILKEDDEVVRRVVER
ncbi:MAG: SDR family oxidoreductase [Myxococcota bacterium]